MSAAVRTFLNLPRESPNPPRPASEHANGVASGQLGHRDWVSFTLVLRDGALYSSRSSDSD
jgi:hypothetical protein